MQAWPKPELFEGGGKPFATASAIKQARVLLRSPKGWMLGVEPGCEEQKELKRNKPVSFSSLAAGWAALVAVGTETGLAYFLALPGNLSIIFPEYGIDTTTRVYFLPLTTPITFLFVFPVVKAVLFTNRQTIYAEDPQSVEYGMPPGAVVEPTLFEWAKAVALKWYSALAGVLTGIVVFTTVWYKQPAQTIGWGATIILIACANLAIAFSFPMAKETKTQREIWLEPKLQARQWKLRWCSTKGLGFNEDNAPVLVNSKPMPEPPETSTHEMVLFRLVSGTKFEHVSNQKAHKMIASAMVSERVLIEHLSGSHDEISVSNYLFLLTYQIHGVNIGAKPHLDSKLDHATWKFAVKHKIISAFLDCKLSTPMFVTMKELSADNERLLLDTKWLLTEGNTFVKCSNLTEQLREHIGCDWLRVYQVPNTVFVGITFGAKPSDTKLRIPVRNTQKLLTRIEWEYLMRNSGMTGKDGNPPTLEATNRAPLNLSELIFSYPPGVNHKTIKAGLDSLRAQTEHEYLDFEYHKENNKFVLLAGPEDPLSKVYKFSDHRKNLLKPAEQGNPHIDWVVGIRANGKYAEYEWDAEQPHLLVAGSSGSGKSAVINSMMCQILHNNHPDDVCFWLADPKNEFVAYQNSAHVRRLVDLTAVKGSQYAAFAALLKEAVDEMEHRYETFARHPRSPQKLSEARAIAQAEPEASGHLNFPYLFLMIEECSDYFAPPADKLDKEAHASILSLISSLARKSRAAGIYIMVATQYPKKENIPTTLKNQCRSIGLFTQTDAASLLIINETGLDKIKDRGRGMISDGQQYVGFRGLLMERNEDDPDNLIDERGDILAELPKSDVWPKLPNGIEASKLATVQGAGWLTGVEVKPPQTKTSKPSPSATQADNGDTAPPAADLDGSEPDTSGMSFNEFAEMLMNQNTPSEDSNGSTPNKANTETEISGAATVERDTPASQVSAHQPPEPPLSQPDRKLERLASEFVP